MLVYEAPTPNVTYITTNFPLSVSCNTVKILANFSRATEALRTERKNLMGSCVVGQVYTLHVRHSKGLWY